MTRPQHSLENAEGANDRAKAFICNALPGCVLGLALLLAPATASSQTQPAPTSNLFTVEPFDGQFIALVDAEVHRAPSEEAEAVSTLVGGMMVQVTARISGANWYRVSLESGQFGFVQGHLLRDSAQAAASESASNGQVAALPRQGSIEVFQDCKGCPKMVHLEAGSYVMGSNFDELTEAPAHAVTIGQAFALSQYEVTVAEWMQCVAASACTYAPKDETGPDESPVRNISWEDAQEYLRWLNQHTGKPYRLPSEAEWEYAARSGSTTKYWWGNEMAPGLADCQGCGGEWQKAAPAPVGTNRINPFGLYGMAGGVAEWTADCWSRSHKDAPVDGSARNRPGCKKRVLRGGSWRDAAAKVRSSARHPHEANIPSTRHGLRIALTLD